MSVRVKAPLVLPYLVFFANIHFHFLALSDLLNANSFKKKKYSRIIIGRHHATDLLHSPPWLTNMT